MAFDYSYLSRDQLRSGTAERPNPDGQETQTHIVGAAATVGLTNSFSGSVSVPLLINRSLHGGTGVDDTQVKFGDLVALMQYSRSTEILSKPLNLRLAGGVTIPLGEGVRNIESDNRNLTSGTVDPILDATAVFSPYPGWNLLAGFYTRQIVGGDSGDFRAGDSYRYQVGITFAPIGRSYDVSSRLRFFDREPDLVDGARFDNSGGEWWYLALAASRELYAAGESALRLWAEYEMPLRQDVTGTQLTGSGTIRGGLSLNFAILGHGDDADDHHLDKSAAP